MEEIKVLVPAERVTEFYRWFADWSDGAAAPLPVTAAPASPTPESKDAQLTAGVMWWKSLKRKERAVWSIWIDAAPRLVAAKEIVKALDLNGPRDIPGILSWVGRKGERASFRVNWTFTTDPVTDEPVYGIDDTDYAALLRRVRSDAEAAPTNGAAR